MILGVAILGVVGTLLGILLGARINERAAAQRLRVEQQTAHRRAQFERLREMYARMASSGEALRMVVGEQSFILAGETLEGRDERHDRIIRETQHEMSTVGGFILVDPGVAEVRDAYSELWHDFDACLRVWRTGPPGTETSAEITRLTESVNQATDRVVALARAHLAGLDVTPQVPDPGHWWKIRE